MENNKNTKYNKSVKKYKDFNPFPQNTDNINEKLTELGSNIDEQSIQNKKINSRSLMDNPTNDKNIEKLCKYFEESFKQDELIDEDTESKNFLLSFRKSNNNSITNQELDLISDLTKGNDENQYLKPKEWKYINKINFEEIDNKFIEVKNKFYKEEVKEIYNNLKIKTIDSLYKEKQEKEPKNIINKLENLDNMIDNYLFVSSSSSSMKKIIDYEREELEKYIYKYRYIFKDNNNFYRCVIFGFLENIVLTNNFMCLKEFLIEIDDKISLKNETINSNDYLKNEVELNININLIKMLLYILIKYMCKNINKSYETLIKIYLLYEEFDYGMIFIIRLLLHEYINENKYKIFSKDNKVDIIELLPQKYTNMYITNEKKFELFYINELFKMKSYDNKLVFYMIPFFFDINLKIISYYHGAENQIYNKFYRNEKDKYILELISYKGNLDICYNKKYYEFHSKYLNIFEENNEKILYIKKSSNNSDIDNKSYQKYQDNKDITNNNNNINIIIENNIEKDNNEDNENNLNIKELKKINILKCNNCSKEYKGKENKLKLCPECLDEEFRNDILKLYDLYLQYVDHNYKKYGFQIDKYFGSIIHTIKINEITIYDAMADTGYLVYEIFKKIKINICLICRNDTSKNYYYELPCKCRLCSKKCFKKYIEIMIYQDYEKIEKNNFKRMIFVFDNCICGKKYYYPDLLVLYNYFKNKNKIKICEMIIKIVKNRWKWRCIKCDKNFDPFCMNYRLSLFDTTINKDFYDKELKHLICSECYDSIYLSQIKHVKCVFCKSEHYIVDSKRLTYENKSGDLCCII